MLFFLTLLSYMPVNYHICNMENFDWNKYVKQLLKSELVRRGISHDELVTRLRSLGVEETKASVESKISRGTFSAVFLIQCLNVIECKYFIPNIETPALVNDDPIGSYQKNPRKKTSKYTK